MDPSAKQWWSARWQDRHLLMPGLAPLPLSALAARAHARNFVTGAMAHSFSRWAWSKATFAAAVAYRSSFDSPPEEAVTSELVSGRRQIPC
jgi:hypothetical protein